MGKKTLRKITLPLSYSSLVVDSDKTIPWYFDDVAFLVVVVEVCASVLEDVFVSVVVVVIIGAEVVENAGVSVVEIVGASVVIFSLKNIKNSKYLF